MKSSLIAGVILLALTAAPGMAAASSCEAPSGVWGPFKPPAHSENRLATAGALKIVALAVFQHLTGTGATTATAAIRPS